MRAQTTRSSDHAARPPSDAPFELLREMTQLQRAEMPARDRLLRALALAEELLSGAEHVRLFMPVDPAARRFEVLESRHTSSNVVETLGYGEAADREVLARRQESSRARSTLMPLPGDESDLPSVLAVDWRSNSQRSRGEQLLLLVAEQFTALLDIMTHQEHETQLAAALEQQDQAFDKFISMAAHELRSPLTSIKGYAQLLVRQAQRNGLPEATLHSAETIVEQGSRLADMVAQLYDAAHIRRDKFEIHRAPTDLVPLVRKQAEQWRAAFPHHRVQLTITADSLVGNWDAQRVAQVIQNLVENAARFSPDETNISVEVGRQGDEAAVYVRDEGIGIPVQDQLHIFEYMYRSPEAEARNLTGLGLGLFVSTQLAERMGGHVQLQRSPLDTRTGSEFYFTLPLTG
ncbi:MAG TPA: HAMP domain-containing sensor histidine kinase [Ktedonobacterales bacterium]|nr:HAMP domain-containing sensor histidine kinase [Ktedonobacterales bacterium]